jgi:flagellar FliJ protein
MQRFRFTLEPVLEQRRRIEDEKQRDFAARTRELRDAESLLERLHAQYQAAAERLRDGHRSLSTEDLRLHYAHLEYLDRAITAQRAVVAERRGAVERARAALVEASKERKVIEKLKERKHEQYVAEARHLEQAELDDANARRFARLQPSGGSP